jgi:hypothetical protein
MSEMNKLINEIDGLYIDNKDAIPHYHGTSSTYNHKPTERVVDELLARPYENKLPVTQRLADMEARPTHKSWYQQEESSEDESMSLNEDEDNQSSCHEEKYCARSLEVDKESMIDSDGYSIPLLMDPFTEIVSFENDWKEDHNEGGTLDESEIIDGNHNEGGTLDESEIIDGEDDLDYKVAYVTKFEMKHTTRTYKDQRKPGHCYINVELDEDDKEMGEYMKNYTDIHQKLKMRKDPDLQLYIEINQGLMKV